ncbi:hypothetical protein BT69DRAFT_1323026 [Atractiella rhizophila]|nr:hypothetical protein BT69DRAFT_1323026 [Atractiella rhizophila]
MAKVDRVSAKAFSGALGEVAYGNLFFDQSKISNGSDPLTYHIGSYVRRQDDLHRSGKVELRWEYQSNIDFVGFLRRNFEREKHRILSMWKGIDPQEVIVGFEGDTQPAAMYFLSGGATLADVLAVAESLESLLDNLQCPPIFDEFSSAAFMLNDFALRNVLVDDSGTFLPFSIGTTCGSCLKCWIQTTGGFPFAPPEKWITEENAWVMEGSVASDPLRDTDRQKFEEKYMFRGTIEQGIRNQKSGNAELLQRGTLQTGPSNQHTFLVRERGSSKVTICCAGWMVYVASEERVDSKTGSRK